MKVFVSWSGEASHVAAVALTRWLDGLDDAIEPFESAHEISKGSIWFAELTASLRESSFGIIVLTPENPDAPWINYEAGALFHGLREARLVPLLLGMDGTDLTEGPLSMFQAVSADHDDLLDLARLLNECLAKPRADHLLVKRFEKLWPALEEGLARAAGMARDLAAQAPPSDLVAFARNQRELDGRSRGIFDVVASAGELRVAGGTFKTFCDDARILAAVSGLIREGRFARLLMLNPQGEAVAMLARMRKDYSPRTTEERLRMEIEMSLERLLDTLGTDAVGQIVRMYDALPRYGLCISDRQALVTLYLHGHGASSPSFSLHTDDAQGAEFCKALAAGFDEAWSSSLSHPPEVG